MPITLRHWFTKKGWKRGRKLKNNITDNHVNIPYMFCIFFRIIYKKALIVTILNNKELSLIKISQIVEKMIIYTK
jgi:hypothetical protein